MATRCVLLVRFPDDDDLPSLKLLRTRDRSIELAGERLAELCRLCLVRRVMCFR